MPETESGRNRGASGRGTDDNVIGNTRGDDRLIGTSGHDRVELSSESIRGSVFQANGTETVHRHGGQTDIYQNIEELRFLDGRLVLDPSDPAAQVARLYQAALGRDPDQAGLNFWIDRLEQGGQLSDLSESFIRSAEYAGRFGAQDNASYVSQLYQNVLGRAGDDGGRSYWTGRLQQGTSRRDVLASFSESDENKAATRGKVAAGIWDRSESAQQVARLYDTTLGRSPDASGLGYWRGRLDDGTAQIEDVADALSKSAEFVAKYGTLSNQDFVGGLYRNTLGRAGDDAGSSYWTRQLDTGAVSRAGVVAGFSESGEHVARTASLYASDDPSRYGITLQN